MKRLYYFLPLAVFLILGIYFALGLQKDPKILPSALINKPVPEFQLGPIGDYGGGFGTADLKGEVSLVNIFGSWCVSCRIEHPFLMKLKRQKVIPIYGIDWRDTPEAAKKWLDNLGDPYTRIGNDHDSRVSIDFGVTGAPETFIVDKYGIIRYKQIGPINAQIWRDKLLPIIEELRKQ